MMFFDLTNNTVNMIQFLRNLYFRKAGTLSESLLSKKYFNKTIRRFQINSKSSLYENKYPETFSMVSWTHSFFANKSNYDVRIFLVFSTKFLLNIFFNAWSSVDKFWSGTANVPYLNLLNRIVLYLKSRFFYSNNLEERMNDFSTLKYST